jgi:hypothetical protein
MGAITRLAAMPGFSRLAGLLVLAGFVAALAGCGSDDISGTIPADSATQLNAQLETVSRDVQAGDCTGATSAASEFGDIVDGLPAEAGTELKDALRTAGNNLEGLVSTQCAPTGATGETRSQPTTSTSTSTTEPPPTTTTSSTTTTTETTTTEETKPQENGGGGDNTGGGTDGGGTDGGGTGP